MAICQECEKETVCDDFGLCPECAKKDDELLNRIILTYGKDYIAGKVLFFDMGIRQETMSILAKLAEKGLIERKELKTDYGIEYFYNTSDLEEWEVIPKI